MRTILLLIVEVVLIAGGIYLYKNTDKFTNFDKVFDKIYDQVDKNLLANNFDYIIEYEKNI